VSLIILGLISALIGVAVGYMAVQYWLSRHGPPKIGTEDGLKMALDDPRYIEDTHLPAGMVSKSLDGVSWYEAPLPPRTHRCWTQQWAFLRDGTFVRRCACGAISMNDYDQRDVYWMDRNEKRDSREKKGRQA